MKKVLFLFCFTLFSFSSLMTQSENYTFFEWDVVGVGLVIPVNEEDLKPGFTIGGEVRFNLADDFSLGLGSNLSFFNVEDLENLEMDQDVMIDYSYHSYVSTDYYLTSTSSNRGFIGLAVGYTDIGDITIEGETEDVTYREGASGLSISPRFGYELGHVRFLGEYHIGVSEAISNFVSLKVSFTLWGDYKG